MLSLNNVRIDIQPLGNSCFIYMSGKKEDIERRFLSFVNHGATQLEEPEWWGETTAVFSTTTLAAQKAFVKAAFFGLLSNLRFMSKINKDKQTKGCKRKKIDGWDIAHKIGFNRWDRMERVGFQKFGKHNHCYSFGEISNPEIKKNLKEIIT